MTDNEFTRILGWPGYRVYRHEIDQKAQAVKLWVRRKRGNRRMACSGCGRKFTDYHDVELREVRDLPWSGMEATVVVEVHRVKCPDCGLKVERIDQVPGKAPFSKRFENAVGMACEGGSAVAVGRQFGLSARQVMRIDKRYLSKSLLMGAALNFRRHGTRVGPIGTDEIHLMFIRLDRFGSILAFISSCTNPIISLPGLRNSEVFHPVILSMIGERRFATFNVAAAPGINSDAASRSDGTNGPRVPLRKWSTCCLVIASRISGVVVR